MSKPMSNPFFEADLSKMMDVTKMMDMSKMFGEFKMPTVDVDALMNAQRKNVEAMTSINQAVFQTWQDLAQRQMNLVRQSMEELSTVAQNATTQSSPEEKILRQAEASKAAVEKAIANAREVTDTLSKCNEQTLKTLTTRMNEGVEELRTIVSNGKRAA